MLIGLTGGIASGKSVVANVLKDLGIAVIDTDVVAREVVEKNKPAYNEIVSFFGEKILNKEKDIARNILGELVFNDKSLREKLNSIIHPFIMQEVQIKLSNLLNLGIKNIILVVPLLFETKMEKMFDEVWVVYCSEETQKQRLIKRDNLTEVQAMQRIKSQLPLAEKKEKATVIINSDVPLQELINKTKKLAKRLKD